MLYRACTFACVYRPLAFTLEALKASDSFCSAGPGRATRPRWRIWISHRYSGSVVGLNLSEAGDSYQQLQATVIDEANSRCIELHSGIAPVAAVLW